MKRKRKSQRATEFHTIKRLDNTRLVHHREPAKVRNLYRTLGLASVLAMFLLLYIFQHYRCIDLSFQLEDVKLKKSESAALNSSLKLEIAGLSDPKRIDMIARHSLGLKEASPSQVREYQAPAGAEVATVQYVPVSSAQ